MRNMSFALTTEQVRAQTKTVTRRVGWKFAKPGDVVQPVVKAQGLKKGERVEKIGGPIRFVRVQRVWLTAIDRADLAREGFPDMTPAQFVEMFENANGGTPDGESDQKVTRIEFEYIKAQP